MRTALCRTLLMGIFLKGFLAVKYGIGVVRGWTVLYKVAHPVLVFVGSIRTKTKLRKKRPHGLGVLADRYTSNLETVPIIVKVADGFLFQ